MLERLERNDSVTLEIIALFIRFWLTSIVVWFPKDRFAFVNGAMIMLGSLGAVTASAPTDWLLNWIGCGTCA